MWTIPKQTTKLVTLMKTSHLAVHPGIISVTKLFCPCFCQTLRKVIFPVFRPRKTDPLSTINSIAFWLFLVHHFELSSGCTLHLLLNMCKRLSAWVSRVPLLFISLVSFPFCFLQFASIALRLIVHMCLIGSWSTLFLREGVHLMHHVTSLAKTMVYSDSDWNRHGRGGKKRWYSGTLLVFN